jgi:6-phosphogluconolactonase/glucosamine-6-phosphate isomerase/deaminase
VPTKDEVDWRKVFLYFVQVNHKIVPTSDAGGTHTKGLDLFINACGIPGDNQFAPSLKADGLSKEDHAQIYSAHINKHVAVNAEGLPGFDYMLIGSGSDGRIHGYWQSVSG